MGLPSSPARIWTLFVFLSWIFVGQVVTDPQYLVTVPAVLEAGTETKFCMSLLQPDEPLVIKVTLNSGEEEITLLELPSSVEFHRCFKFQVPMVRDSVNFKVVVNGNWFDSEEVRKVRIVAFRPMTFIQTDKPLYLPGQTVHFRVVTLDSTFRAASQRYDTIEIRDSNEKRVVQWLNTTSNGPILQLSYPLNSEAREGSYRVIVWNNGWTEHNHFKVEKIILPKFDVTVNAPDEISIGQDEIEVEVCAKYTFAQPVPVRVELKMCRPLNPGVELKIPTDQCYMKTKQAEENGCARFNVEMSTFTKLGSQATLYKLKIFAEVIEEGTGIFRKKLKVIKLSHVVGKLFFIDTPTVFNEGSVVEGTVKVIAFNNEPVPDMLVHLWHHDAWDEATLLQNLTTDSHGITTFTLNTTNYDDPIELRASIEQGGGQNHLSKMLHHESARHTLLLPPPHKTKSFSSLEVKQKVEQLHCDKEENFSIFYTLVGETRAAVDVMYLVLSRGNIVMQGHQKVDVHNDSVTEGEISLTLKVTPDFSPNFHVVAYMVLPNEIVIADSAEFRTEKCFSNKVSLGFSPASAIPGEEVTLQVSADPGSLCGVSAVDQSVLIEEPGKTLDTDKIFNLLPDKSAIITDEDDEPCLIVGPRRSKNRHRRHSSESGGFPVFKRLDLKVVTNMYTKLPSCLNFKGKIYYDSNSCGGSIGVKSDFGSSGQKNVIWENRIRTFFPETWIWNLVEVRESGSTDLSLTVPDTITTWETEAFCLSPQGFGLAPRETLTAFQPFFLKLSLPYSIIRGENFELKATVFNYLSSCIMVTVRPASSSDYTLTPLSGEQYTSCLCTNDRKTFSWTMSPSALGVVNVTVSAEAVASHAPCDNGIVSVPDRGRIDEVTRSLIVKAEGTEKTKTYNWLLCPNGKALSEEVELQLPENVIPGSSRASLSVLGDILGRALKNPDGLLEMPYGCGEQNMALLAPKIYILEYLKTTRQLTPAIKEKAANFLTSGYQRQLNYKHVDGAYSTFGEGEGSTWLTAFVLRSFVKARAFIFIDTENIGKSKTWLKKKQQENGCFEQSGKLFPSAMEGGVSDEVTLSAYITAAFLEVNMPVTHLVAQRSLSCLKESIGNLSSNYTTALLAYVFTLAGDMETRALLLKHLDTVSIQQGDTLHWSQGENDASTSMSVEISSYVLLAILSASPTAEDLGYSTRIVKWLTGQQNEYGGFSSTQDTVVALQALALYSSKVFSPGGSSTVTVQSPSGPLTFDVNPNNKLLYQEEALTDVRGAYSLEVKGTACASVQISLHYNIPIPPQVSSLRVEAESSADCIRTSNRIDLKLKSINLRSLITTNMVIMEIKILSGFRPDPWSLRMIKNCQQVDRVEYKNDLVVVYLNKLINNSPVYNFIHLIKEVPVKNLKPALIKMYDFHRPSCNAVFEYMDPCAAGNKG